VGEKTWKRTLTSLYSATVEANQSINGGRERERERERERVCVCVVLVLYCAIYQLCCIVVHIYVSCTYEVSQDSGERERECVCVCVCLGLWWCCVVVVVGGGDLCLLELFKSTRVTRVDGVLLKRVQIELVKKLLNPHGFS